MGTATFERASGAQYQTELAEAQARANAIVSAHAAAEAERRESETRTALIASLSNLALRIQRADEEAQVGLGRTPRAEKAYEAITSDMEAKLAQERALGGEANSYKRNEISYSIGQDDYSAEQLHYGVRSIANWFVSNIIPLEREVVKTKAICATAKQPDVMNACSGMNQAFNAAFPHYKALAMELDHLELIYQQQHQKHQDIIRVAAATN